VLCTHIMIIYTTYIHRIIKDAKRSSFRVFCEFSLQSLWKLLSLTWPWVWGPHMKGLSNSARPSPWCNVVVPLFLEVKYLGDTSHFSTACCIERNKKMKWSANQEKKSGVQKYSKWPSSRLLMCALSLHAKFEGVVHAFQSFHIFAHQKIWLEAFSSQNAEIMPVPEIRPQINQSFDHVFLQPDISCSSGCWCSCIYLNRTEA